MRPIQLSKLVPALAFAALVLLAGAAGAQNIAAGDDVWNTTGDGSTYLTLGNSDWQTICGATGGDQQIVLTGEDLPNQGDGDIIIHRNETADFSSGPDQTVHVQATALAFKSVSASSTPCGTLTFKMGLDGSTQPTTLMTIHRTSSLGGSFDADLTIGAKVTAYNTSGQAIGSVSKVGSLANPGGGTPWAYAAPAGTLNPNAPWHPGVTTGGQPVTVVRSCAELLAQHAYKPPKKKCRVIIVPTEPAYTDQAASAYSDTAAAGSASYQATDQRPDGLIAIQPCTIDTN